MVVNEIYYTKEEMRSIFKYYGKAIRDNETPYNKKVPYELFRRLTIWERGIIVREDEKQNLWFYENEEERLVMGLDDEHDFYHFFRKYYYDNHADYIPTTKGDKNMSTTISWNNNPKEASFTATNVALNESVWNEVAGALSSHQQEWVDNYGGTHKPNYISLANYENYKGNISTTKSNDVIIPSGNLKINDGNFYVGGKELQTIIDETVDKKINKENEKENTNMKGFNFDFGPCTNNNIRMSIYGIAVKNMNDEWVSYNPQTEQIINVDIFNFDGRKYMFKMPVALKDVAKGDVIIHQKKAMFVIAVDPNGLVVVDVMNGEEKKVIPTSNMFGFDFVTKIVSMFNAFAAAPTPDAPFGNFLPFLMMGEDGASDIDPLMIMMMMQNGGANMFSNPMMMYFLCGDKMKDNMLPFMMMMNQPGVAGVTAGK